MKAEEITAAIRRLIGLMEPKIKDKIVEDCGQ